MTYVVDVRSSTGRKVVNEFLIAKGYSPMENERRQRSVYGMDAIDAQLDTGPVVSKAVKRALATGLASADHWQRQRRPKTRLISCDS
jgi:hypothetical protein